MSVLQLNKYFYDISLMEFFILIDGLISSTIFFREYFSTFNKKDIIKKYSSIYYCNTFDRYTLYLLIYFVFQIICLLLPYTNYYTINFLKLIFILISFPSIQNNFFKKESVRKFYKSYCENKNIFIKYSISKLIVNFIENLDINIRKIPNYHIFLIYNHISYNYIYEIIKTYFFITLLYILRSYSNSSLYYYYKAIKLAYFYETGFLFNVTNVDSSIYIINSIIVEKRWNELSKIDILNAFFVLIREKLKSKDSFFLNLKLNIYKIFSIWSLISLSKIIFNYNQLHFEFNYLINIYIYLFAISIVTLFSSKKIKNLTVSIVIYFLMLFNINDLIITLVIIINRVIFYIIEEIYFFSTQINNIKKVLNRI